MPSGYKRLLGITFDGNFRYETGEALTGDDDVTMTLDNLSSSGKNVFGSYNGANGKNFSLYIYGSASSGSYFRYGDQLKRPKYGTGKRTITFGKSGTSGFDSDSDVTPDEFTTPANVYIGMLPNSSSAAYAGDIIGSIIVSNRLEWIPCERESDGVIGYYEKYNDSFLEPVGSGTPVSLGYDDSHLTVLSVEGTPEVLTIGEQTASVANLLAVDDIKDEQNIISGTVTRRCEAVISDGTTPSGRYIGEVGEGNIIVKVRETGYEGDVATFEATEAKPLNGLSVNVEPIQDLHGYDSPWPAGGGKNLLGFLTDIDTTVQGVRLTFDKNTEQFNVSGTNTNTSSHLIYRWYASENKAQFPDFEVGKTYTLFNDNTAIRNMYMQFTYTNTSGTASPMGYMNMSNSKMSFTVPDNFGALREFQLYVSGSATELNGAFHVWLEEGSVSSSTFAPYSNICPISGRTSATVTRTGKNLWDEEWELGSFNSNGQPSSSSTSIRCRNFIPVAPGQTYYMYSGSKKSNAPWMYGIDKSFLRRSSAYLINQAFTIPNDVYYIKIALPGTYGTTYNNDISINYPATDTQYHPYAGNTYTIALGDTVYGGQLDVTQGKMVVDRAEYKLLWSSGISPTVGTTCTAKYLNVYGEDIFLKSGNTQGKTISDIIPYQYNNNDTPHFYLAGYDVNARRQSVRVFLPNDTDPDTEIQFVLGLATPFEITLTPTQIDTLLGTNNVWSDVGTVKAYVADGDLVEHVTAQPMRTAEGSNTVSVTSAVDPVQLEIDYYKNE